MELVWLPRARRERFEAIDFIAERNPLAALGQLDEIERQTDMLVVQPNLGRPGRVKGTRELVISRTPFVPIYRVRPRLARIELVRLLHGAQQWPPSATKAVTAASSLYFMDDGAVQDAHALIERVKRSDRP